MSSKKKEIYQEGLAKSKEIIITFSILKINTLPISQKDILLIEYQQTEKVILGINKTDKKTNQPVSIFIIV